MKKPLCEKHELDFKMNRLYVRIKQKWKGIGFICLVCGEIILDKKSIVLDENQKSILDFKKEKDDETIR